jgi:alanine racemase
MAVVKANAYGHGLLEVARRLANVDCLAVARFAEARRLRDAGISTDIVVLGGPLASQDLDVARDLNLQIAVHDLQQLSWLSSAQYSLPRIWLKVDTGMRRLGIYPDAVADCLERVRPRAERIGLMTHFASADETRSPTTEQQLARFIPLAEGFDGDVSVANSPGLLSWPELLDSLAEVCDENRLWIRPGLAIYGLSPFEDRSGSDIGLMPAMQLESQLLSVKSIAAGDRVGYGGTWEAPTDTVLGVVAAGYGDGYTRHIPSGTPVLVNGRRVPVAGRISMDLTAVDLGAEATDKVGDPVILWGDGLPVEEIAAAAGTIPYALVTGVTHREPAIYED